jgi:hypothetical protein
MAHVTHNLLFLKWCFPAFLSEDKMKVGCTKRALLFESCLNNGKVVKEVRAVFPSQSDKKTSLPLSDSPNEATGF